MTSQRVGVGIDASSAPWRPVQYLGSKLRVLDRINATVVDLAAPGATIWEPFSGSTVVAQSLAASGFRVVAGDALGASATMAIAVLGVSRPTSDERLLSAVRQVLDLHDHGLFETGAASGWEDWLAAEDAALALKDGRELLLISTGVPQRWRSQAASTQLKVMFGEVEAAASKRIGSRDFAASTYAGTYFGLRQAISIDALRTAIDRVAPIDDPQHQWIRSSLLTALFSAASAAAFTPGKHFAQPHRIRDGKDLGFHARRALTDRAVNIVGEFVAAVTNILQTARSASEGHHVVHERVEEVDADDLRDWGVSVAYADPPYTAQQYSRFYHVLDVLMSGVPADLQRVDGEVTRGLYPIGRYLSPFCSRLQAPEAVAQLALNVAKAEASLVLSYSDSQPGSVGNARSISLQALVERVEDAYGPSCVTVKRVPVRYRQFNRSSSEVLGRDDPEFLIVGRPHAG